MIREGIQMNVIVRSLYRTQQWYHCAPTAPELSQSHSLRQPSRTTLSLRMTAQILLNRHLGALDI